MVDRPESYGLGKGEEIASGPAPTIAAVRSVAIAQLRVWPKVLG